MPDATTKNHKFLIKVLIWAVVLLGIGVVGYYASQRMELLRADLTQVGNISQSNLDSTLYIPDNYTATSPQSANTVAVMVGGTGIAEQILSIQAHFTYDPNELFIDSLNCLDSVIGNPVLDLCQVFEVDPDENRLEVQIALLGGVSVNVGDTLFKIRLAVRDNLQEGTLISLPNIFLELKDPGTVLIPGVGTIATGRITIVTAEEEDPCENINCGAHGQCVNGVCVCETGYDGDFCETCAPGYAETPDGECEPAAFEDLTGIVLSLADAEINQLIGEEKEDAFSTAYVMVNSSQAAGYMLTVQGVNVPIVVDGALDCVADELACINDIIRHDTDGLLDALPANVVDGLGNPLVSVTEMPDMPGVIKIEPTNYDATGWIDISTTAGGVKVLPGMEEVIVLHPTDEIRLQAVGKFSDGSAQPIGFDQVQWLPQPVNQLDNSALDGGILKRGDVPGTTSLKVVVEKTDAPDINSNVIAVNVPAGPVIDYVRRIGMGSIVQGSRINLRAKVSDVHEISNIQDISTSIVRSDFDTYEDIDQDPNAIWFTATPFVDEVEILESDEEGGEGEGEGEDEGGDYYRIYSIPVDVPYDVNLIDGHYKLVLEITDMANYTAANVLPIYIGELASGDVDGDGQLSMLDVILAFQIVNGSYSPTPEQLRAADMNNDGDVTMLDVVLLFNQVNQ